MRPFVDRLAGVCFTLLLAAIALRIAFGLVHPLVPALTVVASIVVGLVMLRIWHRSRW